MINNLVLHLLKTKTSGVLPYRWRLLNPKTYKPKNYVLPQTKSNTV